MPDARILRLFTTASFVGLTAFVAVSPVLTQSPSDPPDSTILNIVGRLVRPNGDQVSTLDPDEAAATSSTFYGQSWYLPRYQQQPSMYPVYRLVTGDGADNMDSTVANEGLQ